MGENRGGKDEGQRDEGEGTRAVARHGDSAIEDVRARAIRFVSKDAIAQFEQKSHQISSFPPPRCDKMEWIKKSVGYDPAVRSPFHGSRAFPRLY